ncbi:MAG: lmo0937 family membrane protein [Bradymonadaceae bacterium]
MLWTIAIILLVLWVLGLITGTTVGGFVHLLIVLAVIVVAINLIQGRRGAAV